MPHPVVHTQVILPVINLFKTYLQNYMQVYEGNYDTRKHINFPFTFFLLFKTLSLIIYSQKDAPVVIFHGRDPLHVHPTLGMIIKNMVSCDVIGVYLILSKTATATFSICLHHCYGVTAWIWNGA